MSAAIRPCSVWSSRIILLTETHPRNITHFDRLIYIYVGEALLNRILK